MSYRNRSSGFTLIELMVTVAILAIIASFAAPSFQSLIESNRITTQANNLLSAVQIARSEAVKLGDDVTISGTGSSIAFDNGWCVHTGGNCTGGNILRQFEPARGLSVSSAVTSVAFSSRGERIPQAGANIIIAVQPNSCATGTVDRRREVTISVSGRASVSTEDCL